MKNSKISKKAKTFLDGLQKYRDGGMQVPLPEYQMAGLAGPNGQPIDLINYAPPILGPTMPIGQQPPMQMLQPRTPIAPLQPLASLPLTPVQSSNPFKLPDITVEDKQPKPNFNAIPVIGSAITLGMGIKEGVESYQAKKRADRLRGYFDQDLAERKKDISLGEYVNTPYTLYQKGGLKLGERVSNFRATDSSQSGTTAGADKMEKAKLSAAQQKENQRILAERKARMERSKAAKGKPISAQQIADESAAIGDKFRVFPDDPNSVVDALNPLVMIGDMAAGLGQVPLNIQEGNYGKAAMNVSMPLLTGALAGGKNAAQLANNLANPLAGSNVSADFTTDGIKLGISDILKGRPLFETFPLTKSQKEKIIKKQNEEYKKAIDFTNDWFYQYVGVLRPEVKERIVNINPESEAYLSSRHYEPMKQTNNMLLEVNDEKISKLPKNVQEYIKGKEDHLGFNFDSGESLTFRNLGPYYRTPLDVAGVGAHELLHSSQRIGAPFYDWDTSYKWSSKISKYDPELKYYTSNESTELGKRFKNALVNPEKPNVGYSYNTWLSAPTELHSELGKARYKYAKNKNLKPYEMQNMSDSQVKDLIENYDLDKHFKKETPLKEKIELIKLLPAITGAAAVGASQEMKEGGIHIDPKNKGKFTAAAKRRGMGVQEFANKVMANKEDYSSLLVKRANFARNAAKWEDGGLYPTVSSDYNTTVELANQRQAQAMDLLQKMQEVEELHKMMYGGMYQDGGMFPSWMNPKNWGVTDYSDKGDFNTAFFEAKKAGEEEFMYKDKRYNTKSDMTPEQQMKAYGITDKQRILNPSIYRKNLSNLNTADGYDTPISDIVNIALGKNEGEDFSSEPNSPIAKEQDALRLYLGLPQKANTFRPSRYKKDAFELTGYNEMLPDEMPSDEEINFYGKPLSQDDFIKTKGSLKNVKVAENYSGNTLKPLEDFVMGKHTVRKGKDDRGEYIEYIDNFDFDTYKYNNIPVGEIGDKFNKPYSIYGRKYYKDYGDGVKKAMYYTDKELSELDANKKNFDTLALQRELGNRGYKLPKSTKKDGKFDGVWGDETKNALLEYQRLQGVQEFKYGGMIKRADGTYSRRGLWDNIRANRGSGKEPTKEMLEQEKKIKAEDGMIVPQQNFFEESINTLPSMSRTTGTPFKNPGTGSITPAQKQSDIGKPFEYKGCVGGMCAGLARDNKMALKDFRKLNNLYGDAWEIADNMYGQGVDLSNYSNLRVGDIINMSRETFKSDKAKGIPSSNQHVGYVSKIENGIPYVKHYIPNTGVMKKMDGDKEVRVPYGEYFEEPINNISAKYKYTATGASRLDWTREIDKKPSEFKFDRGYMPNKIEKAFMDVHNQKPDIQEKLKLTSDEYEQLSRVAYGIMGAESNYGKSIKTAYRMLVPDKYQEKIKIARDFLTGEEHGYDENINTLSRGYASLKSSTLYNIQDNNVNELQDIQRKVGVKPDGLYGPATKKAIEQYNAKNPNNPIKYRSVEERVREGDFEGLDKSGNYLYYALNRLGVDDKDLDSPEASTKALIATLAWHKKNNPNATDDDLIKAYTGKKNITNYKTVYDKYARNIDKIYGNSATPDMLTSVWENILTDVSLAGNETRKNFKKVTSAIASAVRDVAPLPIPVTAILGDIYGAKGDFTEKSLTSYTEDKLKEIVARQVKQGKYTLDYNAYFPEMSREDRLAISGGGGGSSSGMSKVAKLFSPEGMLQNFLGQAVIKPLGNGEYEIRDTYDFNDAGESFGVMEDLKRRGPDPYSIFRSLGRNYGSKDGLGAKVRIRIKLDN